MKRLQILIRYIAIAILTISFTNCKVSSFSISKIGLVAFYPFNGNALDASGNSYHGKVFGARLTTDRYNKTKKAYEFDGVDDLINTFSTFDYPYRTISLWVNSYDNRGVSPYSRVIIAQDSPLNSYGITTIAFADGMLCLNAGGEKSARIFKNALEHNWYHLALVRNGTKLLYYINGKLVCEGVAGNNASTSLPNPHLIIGAGRSTKYQFFYGKIDDIAIYDRALSPLEIFLIFNNR